MHDLPTVHIVSCMYFAVTAVFMKLHKYTNNANPCTYYQLSNSFHAILKPIPVSCKTGKEGYEMISKLSYINIILTG